MEVTCKDSIPLQRILDHLKSKHTVNFEVLRASDGRHSIFLSAGDDVNPRSPTSRYGIMHFADHKFIFSCVVDKEGWLIKVLVVGDKTQAQRFGVEVSIERNDAEWPDKATMGVTFKGNVYSILEDKADIAVDRRGVLLFTNCQGGNSIGFLDRLTDCLKMGDGLQGISSPGEPGLG